MSMSTNWLRVSKEPLVSKDAIAGKNPVISKDAVVSKEKEGRYRIILVTDIPGHLVLHCGAGAASGGN
jgi:hypothetical protein